MSWTVKPQVAQMLAEPGTWGRHLVSAWRACAAPTLAPPRPRDPTIRYLSDHQHHAELLAYWGPLLHLLHFGLGWTRPDLGLLRWFELGRPVEEPVLQAVHDWYRDRLGDFVAWASCSELFLKRCEQFAAWGHYNRFEDWSAGEASSARWHDPLWKAVWGGYVPPGSAQPQLGDPLHLTLHLDGPTDESSHDGEIVRAETAAEELLTRRVVLVLGRYAGWRAELAKVRQVVGASWQETVVDVFCRPIGWLGEYRISPTTGGWFRGDEYWHLLGA